MRDEDIPVWVPSAVKEAALALPEGEADAARRLLTDPRMEKVWRTLLGQPKAPWIDQLDEFLESVETPQPQSFTQVERACAQLFRFAAQVASQPRTAQKTAGVDRAVGRFLEAGNLCREMAKTDPFVDELPGLRDALSLVAQYFDSAAQVEAAGYLDAVQRSSRARGDDVVRVKARAIAIRAQELFGASLFEPIATIVSVALAVDVSAKSIENWSSQQTSQ